MKTPYTMALACFLSVAPSWGEVVWSEDFDSFDLETITTTNRNLGNIQPANSLSCEVVAPPAGFDLASGNVILISTEANNFASIRPSSNLNPINLPPVADGLTWTLSFDIFLPAEPVNDVGGVTSFRWKDGGTNNQNGPQDNSGAVFEVGEHRIVYTGTFPIDGNNGPFLPTNVRPFIGFAQGEETLNFVYLDNIVFEVDVSEDDPNLQAEAVNFGTLPQNEGTYTRPVTIENTGADDPLTITGAEVGGFDATRFSIMDPGFPLVIAPGGTGTILVTFDPGEDVGDFLATIEVTSDDQSDPVSTIDLAGATQDPFIGTELIVNGNFENGDLTGWDDIDNLTFQEAPPARQGSGSAVYTMVANQEFGTVRLFTEPPLGAEEDFGGLTITEEMLGAPYEYSAWYYRPSVNGIGGNDEMSTIFRWNGQTMNADIRGRLSAASMPFDTWVRVVGTGFVPSNASDGTETTYVVPVFSFRDNGGDNTGGEIMFIDEVSFKVDAPPPVLPPEAPEITSISLDGGTGVVSIAWSGQAGFIYSFERSASLSTWEIISGDLTAEDGGSLFEDPDAASLSETTLFYRLRKTAVSE